MRFDREQYLSLMKFGDFERPMFSELFGLLVGLEAEWRAQGASEEEIALTAFDFDYVETIGCGGNPWAVGGEAELVLEDTDTMLVTRDQFGRVMMMDKRTATLPVPQSFPVKTMDDWLKYKPMFEFFGGRIDWEQVERAKEEQKRGVLVRAKIPGGFDMVRELMGEVEACMGYYDQPELIADMLGTFGETARRVYEPILEEVMVDQLSVHEDFAGKSGPFVGPVQMRDFIGPYYRSVWEMFEAKGTKLFDMDTDGNANAIMEEILGSGINSMHPMEPAAGVDVVELRKKYGTRLAMRGGIDKHVLRQGKDAIRKELEYKLQPLMREGGGIVFGLDHRIPNGTPVEGYRYYVETAREILGLGPVGDRRGWERMAF